MREWKAMIATAAVTAAVCIIIFAYANGTQKYCEEAVRYGLPEECMYYPHSERCHMAMYKTFTDSLKAVHKRLDDIEKNLPAR